MYVFIVKIKIENIIVKKRIRKNLGDIVPLAESLKSYGLMNPVVVDDEGRLIAGERRLEAAKLLGWEEIEANIVPKPKRTAALEMEIDENVYRKAFTSDELADAFDKLDKLKNPGLFRKIWLAIVDFFIRLFGSKKKII